MDRFSSRLSINGLTLELQTAQLAAKRGVSLPGCNGPNPNASTGPLSIKTISDGRFVSMDGMQTVQFDQGCWEMVWLKDQFAGSLVCGFQLAADVSRNGAVLPAGGVYVSFPVFTKESWQTVKERKEDYESSLKKHTVLQAEELQKMEGEKNPFMKAVHFRNAVGANEKASMMRTSRYDNIPVNEEDVVAIGEDLLLCMKGTVWTKRAEQRGKKDNHTRVGRALLKN